jgi:hypothetical protein
MCFALAPHTRAYLKVSFRVLWTWSQTSSIDELFRTMRASLKSGSTPCLVACERARLVSSQQTSTGGDRRTTIPLGIYAHQSQFLPTPLHDVLDAEIELTAHDDCLWLSGQLVQEVKRDGVNLVVDIETSTSFSISHTSKSCLRVGRDDIPTHHRIYFR